MSVKLYQDQVTKQTKAKNDLEDQATEEHEKIVSFGRTRRLHALPPKRCGGWVTYIIQRLTTSGYIFWLHASATRVPFRLPTV